MRGLSICFYGDTTFGVMTLGVMTLGIMTTVMNILSIMTLIMTKLIIRF